SVRGPFPRSRSDRVHFRCYLSNACRPKLLPKVRRSRYRKARSARFFRRLGESGDPPNTVFARNNGPAAPLRRRDFRVGEEILKLLSRAPCYPIAVVPLPDDQLS